MFFNNKDLANITHNETSNEASNILANKTHDEVSNEANNISANKTYDEASNENFKTYLKDDFFQSIKCSYRDLASEAKLENLGNDFNTELDIAWINKFLPKFKIFSKLKIIGAQRAVFYDDSSASTIEIKKQLEQDYLILADLELACSQYLAHLKEDKDYETVFSELKSESDFSFNDREELKPTLKNKIKLTFCFLYLIYGSQHSNYQDIVNSASKRDSLRNKNNISLLKNIHHENGNHVNEVKIENNTVKGNVVVNNNFVPLAERMEQFKNLFDKHSPLLLQHRVKEQDRKFFSFFERLKEIFCRFSSPKSKELHVSLSQKLTYSPILNRKK